MPRAKTDSDLHRVVPVTVLVTKEERNELGRAAEEALMTISSLIRIKVLLALRREVNMNQRETTREMEMV